MFHNSHESVRACHLFWAGPAHLHSHFVEDWALHLDLLPPSSALHSCLGGLVTQSSEFLEGVRKLG